MALLQLDSKVPMTHPLIESLSDIPSDLYTIGWREKRFLRHKPFLKELVTKYREIAKSQSYVQANMFLASIDQELKLLNTGLSAHAPDHDIVNYAKVKSAQIQRDTYKAVQQFGKTAGVQLIIKLVNQTGLTFPLGKDDYTKREIVAALARTHDEMWWRRKLRKAQKQIMERFCRKLGIVHQAKQIYVSDFNFRRRQEQKHSNQQLLEKLEAVNQDGQCYTLAELSELSTSNPVNRRNELMTRIRGCEEYAADNPYAIDPFRGAIGWESIFLTITTPSKFHRCYRNGGPNEKWDGSSPSEAQAYLNKTWQRVRAEWKRQGFNVFGFRIVEPHHDGTPHWHMLLFIPAHQLDQCVAIYKTYAFEEDGNETGAEKHRFKSEIIDPEKGSATGYVAKYISKNIDGYKVGEDSYGKDAIISAMRIEAWASTWGIRQFQPIGQPAVTIYREARRINSSAVKSELLKDVVNAADQGNWPEYIALMGGPSCPKKDRPIKTHMIVKGENIYGEAIKVIQGLIGLQELIVTRLFDWTIRKIQPKKEAHSPESRAPPQGGANLDLCQ